MSAPSIRPSADPQAGVAHAAPGDIYTEAARDLSRESVSPAQEALDADREAARVADGDPDLDPSSDGLAGAKAGEEDATTGDASLR